MTVVDAYDSSLNQLTNISSVLDNALTQIYIYTVEWLGVRVGSHPAFSLHSSTELSELS